MIKFLTMADIHISDKNPISRIDDYTESIFNKLEQIRDVATANNVNFIICAGDIFNIKAPTKNSHYLVSRLINLFKSYPCPIYTIYGSHDLSQDNIQNLEKQPINTLLASGVCELIDNTYLSLDEGKKHYQNPNPFFAGKFVKLFAVHYHNNPDYKDFDKEKTPIQICVAHVFASNTFKEFFGEKVFTYEELSRQSPDIFIFGHYHPDQGIEVINKKHFINVGAVSRGTMNKDNIERIPSIGYVEIGNDLSIKSEQIYLNVLSSKHIFNFELKEKLEKEAVESEMFIKELQKNIITSDDNIADKIKNLNFEKEIIDRALLYYER